MIEVKELVKRYGHTTVLEKVSFEVREGQILGLLGTNGAGKSTTMNIITGNLPASEGSVVINGYDILESPMKAKKELGYLPEQPPLYGDMTVKAYLNFAYRLKKCKLPREQHIAEVSRAVQIEDVSDRIIKNLSKGYRQRIGIAQALIGEPKLIILDEPTVGLDPKQMIEIRALIRELGKKYTVILSSHILSEIQAVCNRVVVVNKGRMIADDTPENLAKQLLGSYLKVKIEGPKKEVKAHLEALNEIEEVKAVECIEAGCCAFEIRSREKKDIRRCVALSLKQSPWLLLEMSGADISLENIFLRLTDERQEGDA